MEKAQIEIHDIESEPESASTSDDDDEEEEEEDQPNRTIVSIDTIRSLHIVGISQRSGPRTIRRSGRAPDVLIVALTSEASSREDT